MYIILYICFIIVYEAYSAIYFIFRQSLKSLRDKILDKFQLIYFVTNVLSYKTEQWNL